MINNNDDFNSKWDSALKGAVQEERSVFVRNGEVPKTQRQFVLRSEFEYIRSIAEKNHVYKALEIGCGRGTMALYLNKYLGVDVTATDISEEAIVLAKENFTLHQGVGSIMVADAGALPFPDSSFDMTVSIGLLEHVEDYTLFLSEQYRVLKKSGVMVSLNIPKKHSVQILNSWYRFFLRVCGYKAPLKKDYFRNDDTPEIYAKAASDAGFQEVEKFYSNSFPLFTPVPKKIEHSLAFLYRMIYLIRGIFMEYPFKGSRLLAQEHFLVGIKK